MSPRGLVIAAPASGHGKTTVTLALLRALARAGQPVRPFKTGPDYIDPAFLAAAAGAPAPNLDPWAMRRGSLARIVAEVAAGEIAVVEGVMGLFDGAADGTGSTADLAAMLGLPVVLVVDVRGMGASVAALVEGFRAHRPEVPLAGVILNRVAGTRHERQLRAALGSVLVLGSIPRDAGLTLPSRHLGLVPAGEHPALEAFLDHAAGIAARGLDLPAIAAAARPIRQGGATALPLLPPLGQRIALARDAAFVFAYPETLGGWRQAGAAIVPFSPLADEPPDPAADAVYLPGGYPELHAARLAGCERFMAGLRAAARRGAFVYGECGGYMVLGRGLVDREGRSWPMAGLLPVTTSFAAPRLHLGYRALALLRSTPLGPEGTAYRGHEFHHASEIERGGEPFLAAWAADGEPQGAQGCVAGTAAGSFIHLVDRR